MTQLEYFNKKASKAQIVKRNIIERLAKNAGIPPSEMERDLIKCGILNKNWGKIYESII